MSTLLRCSADLFQAELYIWLLCTVGFKNAGFGKCGPGFIILGIPIPMQGLQQPRPGDTTTNSRGLWSGTKFTKIPSGNLVETGSHASEWISWPPVPRDQRGDTVGNSTAYTFQFVSRHCGPSLDVTHRGG